MADGALDGAEDAGLDEARAVEEPLDAAEGADGTRTSETSGSGLGLAIAKGLIERMHGSITAEVRNELFVIEIFLPLTEKLSEKG